MRNKTSTAGLVAIAFLFLSLMAVKTSAQNATNVHALNVSQGEKQKIQGVVSIRNGDSFKVRDTAGGETTVLLTSVSAWQERLSGDLHHAWPPRASSG